MAGGNPTQSPYQAGVADLDPQTLPQDELIRLGVRAELLGLRVAVPAVVTKVLGNQLVSVQPTIKIKYIDEPTARDLPGIPSVPVATPKGNGWAIKVPIAVGDTGLLIIADRSLDNWLAGSGESVDPQDSRMHDITDAIFFPGLGPNSKQTAFAADDMVLQNAEALLRILKSGKFQVSNGTNELIDLLVKISTQLQILATALSTESTLTNTATYTNVKTALSPSVLPPDGTTLIDRLQTLKG